MRSMLTFETVDGFDCAVLESDAIRARVIPELGGRVWTLEDKLRGRQWIWHRGGVPLARHSVGAGYDDVWAGGWEELFPNDAPGRFEGRDLPDHGEWWAARWELAEVRDSPTVALRLQTNLTVVRAACSKEMRLGDDGASLVVEYGIRSEEALPFHFLFKQHFAVRLTPACVLRLPGGTARAVDPGFSTMIRSAEAFPWPMGRVNGQVVDMSKVPEAASCHREFVYVRDLPESWCGVDDLEARAAIRMTFSRLELPFVWLFLSYGGWRNCYTAVLEPCTNLPKDLAEAVHLGQSARLRPGEQFRTRVTVSVSAVQGSRNG